MQLKFTTVKSNAELITETLNELGANAITIQSADNERIFAVNNEQLIWENVFITVYIENEIDLTNIITLLKNEYNITPQIEKLVHDNWQQNFKQQFKPKQYGEKLWVYPAWEKIPSNLNAVIILEPGLAFGTGTHPTTTMCLTWLEKNISTGNSVIDYGCGTGILAIAAKKLGADNVIAIDNDPQALTTTRQNAEKNNVSAINICSPESCPDIQVDIVIANILANPLIELSSTLSNLVKPNGKLVLSGILNHQAAKVIEAYQKHYTLNQIDQIDDWILLSN